MNHQDAPIRSFVIDDADVSIQTIVSKLRFISRLGKEEKIEFVNDTISTVADTTWNNFCRWWSNKGSKEQTLHFIRLLCEDALQAARKCLSSNVSYHHKVGTMILVSLRESKTGVDSLSETYKKDRWFVSKVETFQKLLETKISDLESTIVKENSSGARKQQHGEMGDDASLAWMQH